MTPGVRLRSAADDGLTRGIGRARSASHSVAVQGGIQGLKAELDQLVADGTTGGRAVFTTRGNEGCIYFNRQRLGVAELGGLAGRGYERIFPFYSRIYLPGCAVEGDAGWNFLRKAGEIFLRLRG